MMNNLPVGWINNDLRTVLEKIIDYRGQSVPKADTGVPLITARNVKKGYLDFSSKEYVDEALYSVWMSRGVPVSTDILFTTEAPLGNACRYPSGEKYAIGQRIVCLRAKKNILDSDYLLYFLLSDHGQTLIDIKSSGSTAKGIKSSELKKIKITYPESISEQIKIAEILSTWDNSINTVQKLLTNSQQQKQSLMQQLLTGKKRFDGFEGEWEEKRLDEISHIFMGSSPKSEFYNKDGIGLPLLQGNADIKNRKSVPRIFTSQITRECLPDDILLSVRAPVGAIASSNHHACIGRGIAAIRAKEDTTQVFLYQWLLDFEDKWDSFSQGSTFESVNSDDINNLKIKLPLFPEQQKIAAVLTTADKEIENLRAQLNQLKQEKKALMQQLLTGKRRVATSKI